MELLEESLVLSHEAGDLRRLTNTLLTLASVSSYRGDRERAMRLYEEGMTLCRRSGNMAGLAQYMTDLGHEFLLQGNHERATVLIEEAGVLFRKQGDKGGLQYALDNLGWAMLLRGDQEEAKASYEESLRLCRELSTKTVAAESIDGLSCVAADRGEAERAARLFGAAQALHEAAGYQQPPQEHALREPYLADARSKLDEASWEAAFAEGRAMTFEEAVEYALSGKPDPSTSPLPLVPPTDQPLVVLTSREQEVASLVARGLTNRQIATELSISERTAANHVAKILRKLGLHSRTQIAGWVAQRKLLAPDHN